MPSLHLLGTGAAVSAPHRTTTMLAVSNSQSLFLIDCGGDIIQRVMAAGLNSSALTGMLITHEHADHVSGFPLFMEKIWLTGRHTPIPVYGPPTGIDQARRCFETFNVSSWENFPDIEWHIGVGPIVDDEHWRITTDFVKHSVPAVGVRIECKQSGTVIAYSGDTQPVDSVVNLAQGADVLVHEATGSGPGHSTVIEAAQIAAQADAKRLLLVHLPPELDEKGLHEAREIFSETEWGQELGTYTF